tara:strand:- start:3855 stop:4907 length:1053 start_codon:yes stop_codon:yes gene_type:complete
VPSPPAVNPYNKDEIEYREPGFDYAPQYPGTYDYSQSGIQYNESNFTYVKRDVTISASTVACSADLSLTFAYVYTPKRPGGVAYSSGYDYNKSGFTYPERDTSIPDNRVLVDYSQSGVSYSQPTDTGLTVAVTATPATIGVTTTFSASPSVPATVTPSTVACPVVIVSTVTANLIVVHAGIEVPATLPTATISAVVTPATVAAAATFPGHTLYITVDATPGVIAGSAAMPSATASSNFTATPAVIGIDFTIGTIEMYERLVMPTENTLPRAINPQDSSPAAYALMRHFAPGQKGTNIFIVNGTTVQTYLPSDWDTVTRWIYGGHQSPTDLTSTEVSVLAAAGYSFNAGPE